MQSAEEDVDTCAQTSKVNIKINLRDVITPNRTIK